MKRGNIKKFARVRSQRKALYKGLATALIEHGKIKTTSTKGKSVASYVERLVAKSKTNNISTRREIAKALGPKAVFTLFNKIAPLFPDTKSGFMRITRVGQRMSDGSPMVILEFTKTWR